MAEIVAFSGAAVIEAVERYSGVVPFWYASTNHHDQISSRARPSQNDRPTWLAIFTARCYASAVLAMGLCLSVSVSVLSVTSRSSTKTAKQRITYTTPDDTPGTLVF